MSRRTLLLLRWGVFIAACAFLYARFDDAQGRLTVPEGIDIGLVWPPTLVAALLMPLNWGLESRKWRLLVRGVEPVTAARSFLATLAGSTIGLITPNRVGEFAGRVLFLDPVNRVSGAFATVVGSIAQFVVTVSLGMVGLIALALETEPDPMVSAWIGLCALVAASALLLYFHPSLLHALVSRTPILNRWEQQASVLNRFRPGPLRMVLLLSFLRYAVFTVQFIILLNAMAAIPMAEAALAIPAIFLIGTLIPTVMLTELGVRGSVAVAMLGSAAMNDADLVLATTVLWLVNIALPAMLGAVVMLVARIRSNES